jgi:hypothetical protein
VVLMWGNAGGRGEVGVCGGNADALASDVAFAFLPFFTFALAIRFKVRRFAFIFGLADYWMKDKSFNSVQTMAGLSFLLEKQGGVKTAQVATEYFHVHSTHSHLLLYRVLGKPCH